MTVKLFRRMQKVWVYLANEKWGLAVLIMDLVEFFEKLLVMILG